MNKLDILILVISVISFIGGLLLSNICLPVASLLLVVSMVLLSAGLVRIDKDFKKLKSNGKN